MPGDELRDGSEGEEQEDGEQRDGSVAEHAGHSKRDLERVKKALMKLHVNLGHPGVKELMRVLKGQKLGKMKHIFIMQFPFKIRIIAISN